MMTGIATCLLYLGCAGLFHTDARRTSVDRLRTWVRARRLLKGASLTAIAGGLIVLVADLGAEVAPAVWLGLLTATGVVSLLIAALAPRLHLASGGAAGMALAAVGISAVLMGIWS